MSRYTGEEKLNKNLSGLKKNRIKKDIRLSLYVLISRLFSFLTKDSMESELRRLSQEIRDLKYENVELHKSLKKSEQARIVIETQVKDFLDKANLNQLEDLKEKMLRMTILEKEAIKHTDLIRALDNIFSQSDVLVLINECLNSLETAKDNFQKLKVVRHFLNDLKKYEFAQKELYLLYSDEGADDNIKNIPLVTELFIKMKNQLDEKKQIDELKTKFKEFKS